MTVDVENSHYYLVIQGREEDAFFLFLGSDPNFKNTDGSIVATPVTLELLPPRQRFGGTGGVAMGKPVVGRWPNGVNRFRQFLTITELDQAGWVLIPKYRICDSWEDFYSPWGCQEGEQLPEGDSVVREALEETNS